jgi:hypothetical protein
MRRLTLALSLTGLIAISPVSSSQAAPLTPLSAAASPTQHTSTVQDNLTQVRWRGGWGIGAGLLAGALIGSAFATPYYEEYPPYYGYRYPYGYGGYYPAYNYTPYWGGYGWGPRPYAALSASSSRRNPRIIGGDTPHLQCSAHLVIGEVRRQ